MAQASSYGDWLLRGLDGVSRWPRDLREAAPRRRALLAVLAGAVSVLAFAPFFVWPVLFLTMPVLVWTIDAAGEDTGRFRRAASGGWWFGLGYFMAGLFWVGEAFLVDAETFAWLLPFAVLLLSGGLALFFAAAAALASCFWGVGFARILVLALSLTATEWLRGHILTGFPWNVLGYALTAPDVFLQSAGLFGIYSLTLWAVVIFAAPLVVLADQRGECAAWPRAGLGLVVAAVPLTLLYGYGLVVLSQPMPPSIQGVSLRVVQPSIAQREKWKPENQGWIFNEHLELSRRDEAGRVDDLAGVTHVIWPEAAMPFLPLEHPEALAAIGDMLPAGVTLLSGALRRERGEDGLSWRAFNSLMVFDDTGTLRQAYDKTHLVPFGEFLPMQNLLEGIGLRQLTRMRGGFTEGLTPRPLLQIAGMPDTGGLICYEAIFPGVGEAAERRPRVFINVTNDGWFGATSGPRQHFHQTRVRAVEEGVPIVRAANNGISAVIDGRGRVIKSLGLNERGVIDAQLPSAIEAPPYTQFGGWVLVGNCLMLALNAALFRWRARSSTLRTDA